MLTATFLFPCLICSLLSCLGTADLLHSRKLKSFISSLRFGISNSATFEKRTSTNAEDFFGALQWSYNCPRISSRGTWGLPSLKLRKKVASPELKKAFEEAEVAHVTKHETMALGWWTFKKWMVSWVSAIYLTLFRSTPHFVVNVFFTGWRVSDMP